MTSYGCPCPFGCWRRAAADKACENCRMGFHGRFCAAFTPRPPGESVWTEHDCAVCGGDAWDHDPASDRRFNAEHPRPGPHAPMGAPVPARLHFRPSTPGTSSKAP